jgi:membrane carboxypeptidase/penicillin-binding protein
MRLDDGAVVAMVGGRDYAASQVDAQRRPGSAFKLFIYFAAAQKVHAQRHHRRQPDRLQGVASGEF